MARVWPGFRLEVKSNLVGTGRWPWKGGCPVPMFEPWKNPEFSQRVPVDDSGAICRPNRAGLAPGSLYREICSAEKP